MPQKNTGRTIEEMRTRWKITQARTTWHTHRNKRKRRITVHKIGRMKLFTNTKGRAVDTLEINGKDVTNGKQ